MSIHQPKRTTHTGASHITASQAMVIAQGVFINRTVIRATLHSAASVAAYHVQFSDGSLVQVAAHDGAITRTETIHDNDLPNV